MSDFESSEFLPEGVTVVESSEAALDRASYVRENLKKITAENVLTAKLVSSLAEQVPSVRILENGAEVAFLIKAKEPVERYSFYIHWGSYRSGAEPWIDDPVLDHEILEISETTVRISKTLIVDRTGSYGAVIKAVNKQSGEITWSAGFGESDAHFEITAWREPVQYTNRRRLSRVREASQLVSVLRGLESADSFVAVISRLGKDRTALRTLPRALWSAVAADPLLAPRLNDIRAELNERLNLKHVRGGKKKLLAAKGVLDRVGIGETVIVSPEGPQAAAGGLAQVVVGLARLMKREELPATVISFLYEDDAGNKHESVENLINNGVDFDGIRMPLKFLKWSRVLLGPTFRPGTSEMVDIPVVHYVRVYEAAAGSVRFLFIRQGELFRELYQSGDTLNWFKRAVLTSKAAYEVLKDTELCLCPSVVLTNDWMTGLLPLIVKTDERHDALRKLHKLQTVHIIHNGGRDYQGIFPTSINDRDCWPLLNLAPEHYFGLSDPRDLSTVNFTAAAIRHSDYVLTVSKNYAQQLLTRHEDEGLRQLLRDKDDHFFGISNGIDLKSIRRVIWKLGEEARKELGHKPLLLTRVTPEAVLRRLPSYKLASKKLIQRRYELTENRTAVICCLVGRLAEQKGLSLMDERCPRTGRSVMRRLLEEFGDLQLIVAGPLSKEDSRVRRFADEIIQLSVDFPQRVAFKPAFVTHREALEITEGSDVFLMPSRYEPGGITQLEALACGTPVIARRVGGLSATLADFSEEYGKGNSFLFDEYSGVALYTAWKRALKCWKNPRNRRILRHDSAVAKNDWSDRKERYLGLLQCVSGVMESASKPEYLNERHELINSCRP